MPRPDILNELGLAPMWKLRAANVADAGPVPGTDSASVPNSVPDSPNIPGAKPNSPGDIPASQSAVPVSQNDVPVSQMNWEQLRSAVANCRKCGLCEKRKQAVFGVGDTGADLFLAGEGPGRDEDRVGEPFVGRAGRLLDLMLAAVGMARGDGVYIANVVKCRPPENRNPTAEESGACMPHLDRQIKLVQPRLLVALGRVAAGRLLNSEAPIAKLRQRLHDRDGLPLVVTYHPAYLLRNPADKRKSWEDLCFIRRVLRGGDAR